MKTQVSIDTNYFQLVLSPFGSIDGLFDKIEGTQYLPQGEDAPLITIITDGKTLTPVRLQGKKKTPNY